ncbi:division plane positioning ATPase MipZ [Burkholderia gladioli]|uniref:nucleotide-binding protein n=1 Tax=Burkholderia gladioli TaxID=28095 RepID=UPI003B50BD5E
MSLVMVGVEKGGAGKSTLTQNLASIRASLNFRVAVFDLDEQGTTSKWHSRRAEDQTLPQLHLERLKKGAGAQHIQDFGAQLSALADKYDDVFIDVGGKDTDIFRAALATVDTIIAPLLPSPADLDTVPDLVEVISKFKKKLDIRVVLNKADPRKRMTKAMIEGMEQFKDTLPLLPKLVRDRESFKVAMAQGRGVHELTGRDWDADAASEMKDLYLGVFGR